MTDFFTTVQTSPPSISIPLYLLMFVVLLGLIWLSVTYYRKQWLWCIYHFLQSFQLLSLYIWYGAKMIPISNSLPFYHCRLAMFALLLLPDKTKLKQELVVLFLLLVTLLWMLILFHILLLFHFSLDTMLFWLEVLFTLCVIISQIFSVGKLLFSTRLF